MAPEAQSLRGKAFTLPNENANSSERNNFLRSVTLDDLRAALVWKVSASAVTFVLEDRTGPWWSASIIPHDSTALLHVNGDTVEIPSPTNYEHDFHLLLDASVAELIVDSRHAITTRIYRRPNGPLQIKVSDLAQLKSLEAWQLRPISKDRLTS